MKGLLKLSIQAIIRKRRQSLLIFEILLVSFSFAIILLCYSSSISSTNSQLRTDTYGTWYGAITSATDEDVEFLKSVDWLDEMGISASYGSFSLGIGTVDDSVVNMGITLQDGSLPKNSGEIAMETDSLSTLGYSYTLGQDIEITIPFKVGENYIYIVKTYTLCGIIKEYSDLWSLSGLNSAIIADDDAETLLAESKTSAKNQGLDGDISPEFTILFKVKDGLEKIAENECNSYLRSSHSSDETRFLVVNTAVTIDEVEAEINIFYVGIILAVTLIATIMVYILQMQNDVKRAVRLRSMGATRGQLRLLIATETLLLCVPSIFLGAVCGTLGIWLLLKLNVYSGSIDIEVSLPWNYLSIATALWVVGIFAIRMTTFQVALSTPLVGRMRMQRKKSNLYIGFLRTLIVLMAIVMCITLIFSFVSSAEPYFECNYWASQPSYVISPYNRESNITDEDIILISSVPGVIAAKGLSSLTALVSTDEIDNILADIFVIDDSDWNNSMDFHNTDIDAFRNGDCVYIRYVTNNNTISPIKASSTITITVDYVMENSESYEDKTATAVNIEAFVDDVGIYDNVSDSGFSSWVLNDSLAVFCSRSFLQKILDLIPENGIWYNYYGAELYTGGEDANFLSLQVYTDLNANYLSTDTTVANIAAENSLYVSSIREILSAKMQVSRQTLIMSLFSGVCIAVVVLLILVSTLRLETESERKRYGILQAVGMSKRQRSLELMRTALLRSVVAVVLGWGVFFLTVIFRNLESIKEEGATVFGVVSSYMSNITNYYMPVWAMVVMTVILFAVVFLICYLSKLSLNRYTLMEMLREDR